METKEGREAEIEVTPEMIEAGAAVIMVFDRRVSDENDLAEWVYEAMVRASRQKQMKS